MTTTKTATNTDDLAHNDLIDLRELLELRDELRNRRDDEDQIDPLEDDERELLAEIERFDDEEVNGDVHAAWVADSPTLIGETYWETYAEEDANELVLQGVEGAARLYFDYERFAADYRHDFEEVTLAGATFLRRSF